MLSTVGRFIYKKYRGILYVEHCGKIYLHKILRNIVCWALWEDYLHKILRNTLRWTVGRFIYTKYWGILLVEHYGNIYLHIILGNTLCWTLRFIYTKYWAILYVEHCRNIYLHKILGITLCWTLWEDVFTQNTEEYCMLSTMGRFIKKKTWGLLYVEHYGKIYLHKILEITLCWTLWEDLFTQNTVCWTLWEDLFTQNTEEKCMFEHCGKIYLNKILRNTVCWALWEDLFTQNTKEYCMLSTVGRFIYTKYWGILYVEYCEKI
jgi:hypothetical protein